MSLGFQLLIFDRGDWLLSGVASQGSFMSISGKTFQISFLFALAAKDKSRIRSDPTNGKFSNSSDNNSPIPHWQIFLSRLRLCSYFGFNLWNYENKRVTIRIT